MNCIIFNKIHTISISNNEIFINWKFLWEKLSFNYDICAIDQFKWTTTANIFPMSIITNNIKVEKILFFHKPIEK